LTFKTVLFIKDIFSHLLFLLSFFTTNFEAVCMVFNLILSAFI